MLTKVIMPKQGLQMTEGTIMRWIVPEGGMVEEGQALFEMETDKLTIEIDAPASGKLLKIIKDEGETVPVAQTIAIIGEEGADYNALLEEIREEESPKEEVAKEDDQAMAESREDAPVAGSLERDAGDRVFISPRARMRAEERGIDYRQVPASGPGGLIIERDVLAFKAMDSKGPVRATPVAAKMAQARGVDLSAVRGSGIAGRVMKEDLEDAGLRGRIVPLTNTRQIISDRMKDSLHTMAQAKHTIRVDMTEAIRLREDLKEEGIKVSYNDILIKVVARALTEFPYMNSSMLEEGIYLKDYVNIGLAIAVEDGLIVPNIKDADRLGLQEIAGESSDLIAKAQDKRLDFNDTLDGTFTITNLGMFDIDEFTAIINPPESGILAVGKIEKNPVVIGDDIVVRPISSLTLTYDHRLIDGAPAAQFLKRIKELLMKPYLLL